MISINTSGSRFLGHPADIVEYCEHYRPLTVFSFHVVEQIRILQAVDGGSGEGGAMNGGDMCWQKFKSRFNDVVRDVIRYAKQIPGFAELDLDDQIALLKGGGFEVLHS